jgi:hypothetical protein
MVPEIAARIAAGSGPRSAEPKTHGTAEKNMSDRPFGTSATSGNGNAFQTGNLAPTKNVVTGTSSNKIKIKTRFNKVQDF